MKKIKVLSLCGMGLAALLVGCSGGDEPTSVVPTTPTHYSVKVVYAETNAPVVGTDLKVQWCNNAGCKLPQKLDENGVAKLTYVEGDSYAIHLLNLPAGYTYNSYESVSNDTNIDVTMHIYKTGTKSGEGTEASPYIISTGYYETTAVAKQTKQYYGVSGLKAGEYTIESYAVSLNGKVDTVLGYSGTDKTAKANTVGDNDGNEDNFKYTFTVKAEEENSTFYFVLLNYTNGDAYSFSVTKTK